MRELHYEVIRLNIAYHEIKGTVAVKDVQRVATHHVQHTLGRPTQQEHRGNDQQQLDDLCNTQRISMTCSTAHNTTVITSAHNTAGNN